MKKHNTQKTQKGVKNTGSLETGRGTIRSNHLAALVTSRVFKTQVVKAKKGKGAYLRSNKHKGQESYLIAA
ncbi:alternative ribosome rescue factor ArfA [Neptuniibacter marinus]|uniref:alternative ribosome rescue factor ArfA n=1 Tax=Neptuniibacter marinus TaxID=1806670 RepID=UPI00082F5382|nr:alternative ribosome rescue factor ArfA [Neptuniibacter marinus]